MVVAALPAEIIEDHIIDKLSGHPPSLEACALVCRAWLHAAQKRIFSRVELSGAEESSGARICNKFNALLRASPHVAQYVSRLHIADGMHNRRWMTQSRQSLSSVLPKLVNIATVEISFASLSWSEASSLRDVLRVLFQQPKIRRLTIRGLAFLPGWDELFYLLGGCRANHVLLYAVTLDPASRAKASRRRRGPAIQRPRSTIGCLETNSSIQDLEDFAFWADNPKALVDISNLPKFSFDVMDVQDLGGCNAILQSQAFRALGIFEVVIENTQSFSDVVTTELDFGRVRHVQLSVREIPYSWTDFGNVLRWYTHIFETSRSDTIEEVTLTCVQWARVDQSLDEQLNRWHALDRALAQTIRHLRTVHLRTESEFPEDVRVGRVFLQDHVEQMLPVLHDRGIVHRL